MLLNFTEVEKIAHLARLQIDAADIPEYAQNLGDILALVNQMQAKDTGALEPMANPHDASQRLRADRVTETNQREALQAGAPAVENGLFLVPKVIE